MHHIRAFVASSLCVTPASVSSHIRGYPLCCSVISMVMQVLEDGQLTDSTGRTVSFKNCLVVMTSNVGSSAIAGGGKSLGFALSGNSPEDDQYKHLHTLVTDELKV